MNKQGDIRITDCESCKENKQCEYGPDPYAEEIHGDNRPMWLCKECIKESAWEI